MTQLYIHEPIFIKLYGDYAYEGETESLVPVLPLRDYDVEFPNETYQHWLDDELDIDPNRNEHVISDKDFQKVNPYIKSDYIKVRFIFQTPIGLDKVIYIHKKFIKQMNEREKMNTIMDAFTTYHSVSNYRSRDRHENHINNMFFEVLFKAQQDVMNNKND